MVQKTAEAHRRPEALVETISTALAFCAAFGAIAACLVAVYLISSTLPVSAAIVIGALVVAVAVMVTEDR